VHGTTRLECQRALDDLCRLLGAQVTLPPADMLGSWIARAERKEAPDRAVRGFAVR